MCVCPFRPHILTHRKIGMERMRDTCCSVSTLPAHGLGRNALGMLGAICTLTEKYFACLANISEVMLTQYVCICCLLNLASHCLANFFTMKITLHIEYIEQVAKLIVSTSDFIMDKCLFWAPKTP